MATDISALAQRVQSAVAPNDAQVAKLIDVGEPLAAIIDAVEVGAEARATISSDLRAEVETVAAAELDAEDQQIVIDALTRLYPRSPHL